MPSLTEIRAQIAALPHKYIFFTRKEIRALPEIMTPTERVLALTSGIMNDETWLAVCTNERLIFLDRGMFYGLRQVQMPLERVQSIDHGYGLLFGFIRVWDGMEYFTMRQVLRSSIAPFVQTVQAEMQKAAHPHPAPAPQAPRPSAAPAMDLASELEHLAALKEKGVLTEAEFQTQKKKLLGVS